MASVKFDLATLTMRADELARLEDKARQLEIAKRRYMDSVTRRTKERFQDPAEVERYLND